LDERVTALEDAPAGSSVWGGITGTLSNQTDLQTALNGKQNTEVGKGLSTNDLTNTLKSNYDLAYSQTHTHANKTTLDAIQEALTSALKTAYDSAVTWISTNGTNILNHVSSTSNPHSVTAVQVGAVALGSVLNRKIYNYQNTDSSITGTTNQTVVANLLVSGGVMDANSKLIISSFVSKTGTLGSLTIRGHVSTVGTNTVGTTGTPSSSTLIFIRSGITTQVTLGKIERSLVNKNSVSTNIVYPAAIDAGLENVLSTTSPTTVNINTSNNFWVVITAQLSNSGDTGILNDVQLYIDKP